VSEQGEATQKDSEAKQGHGAKRPSRGTMIALAVFVLALAFRFLGLGWGLKNDLHNASFHPDEPIIFANSRAIEPGLGRLVPLRETPRFYSYGTLYLVVLRIASDVATTYGGEPKSLHVSMDPTLVDWDWVSRCHYAGRIISSLAGAGTVWIICLLMLRRVGEVAGGFAGVLAAIAPAHVLHSRFQTVDVTATFFLAVSLFYSCEIGFGVVRKKNGRPVSVTKLALLSGVFAGLSAGTKYTGILALIGLLVAITVAERKRSIIPAVIAAAAGLAVFVLTTPGILLQTQAFIDDFAFEMSHTSTGHGLAFTGTGNGFLYTLTNLFLGIGPVPVLIGFVGLGYAAFRKHRWSWVLIAFSVPYFILISRSQVRFVRYSFPLYVGVAAGFGYAMQVCHRQGGWSRAGVGLGLLGMGGVPFGGLASATAVTASMMGEDPRDEAARYLKPMAGPVGLAHSPWFWTASVFPDAADSGMTPLKIKLILAKTQSKPPIALAVVQDGGMPVAPGWDMDLLQRIKPPLVSFSSFEYFPILRLKGNKDLGEQQPEEDSAQAFLKALEQGYTIDRQFGSPTFGGSSPEYAPEDLFYTEPVIYVWKKKL
jgi:hypothetical protein